MSTTPWNVLGNSKCYILDMAWDLYFKGHALWNSTFVKLTYNTTLSRLVTHDHHKLNPSCKSSHNIQTTIRHYQSSIHCSSIQHSHSIFHNLCNQLLNTVCVLFWFEPSLLFAWFHKSPYAWPISLLSLPLSLFFLRFSSLFFYVEMSVCQL